MMYACFSMCGHTRTGGNNESQLIWEWDVFTIALHLQSAGLIIKHPCYTVN